MTHDTPSPDTPLPAPSARTTPTVPSRIASAFSSLGARLVAVFTLLVTMTGCGGANFFELVQRPQWGCTGTIIILLDAIALVDVIGDDTRATSNRVLWGLAIIFMPLLGVILYFLFGRK